MSRTFFLYMGGFLVFLLAACAATGERYPVTLSYQGGAPSPARPALPQKIVVFPLEDTRKDPKLIGRRTHLFGRVDTFETAVPAGQRIAELLVEAFRQRGWDARLAGQGIRPEKIAGDRVVTGKIQTLWAEATSHFGYTQMDTRIGFGLKILDPVTGEKITFKIEDQSAPKVVFFHSELIQDTLNEMVSSGLNRIRLSGGS